MLNKIEENEFHINGIHFCRFLWKSRFKILGIAVLFVMLSIVYSLRSPKFYKSTASFFISNTDNTSAAFSGYASMLGMTSSSEMEKLILNILGSQSIKEDIATQLLPFFNTDIQKAINRGELKNEQPYIVEFVIKTLRLEDNFSFKINNSQLFILEYTSIDPKLTTLVLSDYLEALLRFNDSLDLTAEKDILTIIDYPRVPLNSFKPNLILNTLMAFSIGLFFSIFYFSVVFFVNFFREN